MIKPPIKRGQVWKQKGHDMKVLITGTKGGKWKAKVLTEKIGVYNGSHSLNPRTIHCRYELMS